MASLWTTTTTHTKRSIYFKLEKRFIQFLPFVFPCIVFHGELNGLPHSHSLHFPFPRFYSALLRITQPENTENIGARPSPVELTLHTQKVLLASQQWLCWELPCSIGPCCLLRGCDLGVKCSLQFQKMPDLLKEAPEEEHVSLKRFATSEKVGVHAQRPSKNRTGAQNQEKDSIAVSTTLINL